MTAAVATKRSAFHGVLQIVRFNWSMYLFGVMGFAVLALVLALIPMPRAIIVALIVLALPAAMWMLLSLTVSHWVYDRSRLCRWDWILSLSPDPVRTLVNIHSGFDESSDTLRDLYPEVNLRVLDIFDAVEMTEPSIARARRMSPSNITPEPADFRKLFVDSESADLVTLLLAAHEIRNPESRRAFFDELRRILAPGGRIIIAEHLRDLPNFLAFGPGFLHFHSHRTWVSAIESSGMNIEQEQSITPFIRVFVIGRNP